MPWCIPPHISEATCNIAAVQYADYIEKYQSSTAVSETYIILPYTYSPDSTEGTDQIHCTVFCTFLSFLFYNNTSVIVFIYMYIFFSSFYYN